MIPSIGRIVHITLSDGCAENINRRRINSKILGAEREETVFAGNPVSGGQIFPMMITRIWDDKPREDSVVQGQIFLDGNDTYWVSSVKQGTEKGQWFSPPRV